MRSYHLSCAKTCASMHQHVPYGAQDDFKNALKSEIFQGRMCTCHICPVPHEGNNQSTVVYKLLLTAVRVEWMKGICPFLIGFDWLCFFCETCPEYASEKGGGGRHSLPPPKFCLFCFCILGRLFSF